MSRKTGPIVLNPNLKNGIDAFGEISSKSHMRRTGEAVDAYDKAIDRGCNEINAIKYALGVISYGNIQRYQQRLQAAGLHSLENESIPLIPHLIKMQRIYA